MKLGLKWEKADAHVKASSKVDLSRKPPNIMKLCRLRYWGCMIWTDWICVDDMYTASAGFLEGVFGSIGLSITSHNIGR